MPKISYKKILLKKNKEPITCLTAYSKPLAKILDGNVDLVLVGDSLGTTLYGMKNTRSVNLEMMKNHGKAVVSNTKKSMTIIDMPYKTYRNKKEALRNALDILTYTKADFIKIETDIKNIDIVKHLSRNNIKVVSHIGITPRPAALYWYTSSAGRFMLVYLLARPGLVESRHGVTQWPCYRSDAPPLCYGVQLWGHSFGFNRPPPIPGVLYLLGLDCGIGGMFFMKLSE